MQEIFDFRQRSPGYERSADWERETMRVRILELPAEMHLMMFRWMEGQGDEGPPLPRIVGLPAQLQVQSMWFDPVRRNLLFRLSSPSWPSLYDCPGGGQGMEIPTLQTEMSSVRVPPNGYTWVLTVHDPLEAMTS